ncbi:MAG: hypothetical protein WC547_02010 [Candidatus Omnitrophota bacterium]
MYDPELSTRYGSTGFTLFQVTFPSVEYSRRTCVTPSPRNVHSILSYGSSAIRISPFLG